MSETETKTASGKPTAAAKPLRVTELVVENFQKISAVTITPTTDVVEISGKNGQGKTSTLDALWIVIQGAKVAPIKPIKTGAEQAVIRLSLGDLIVTRTFKKAKPKEGEKAGPYDYTTAVTVESAEGARFPSPQKLLDTFYSELTLDPTAFEKMDDAKRFEFMKRFVPGIDFDLIAGQNKKDYDDRRDNGRELDKAVALVASFMQIPETTPDEPLDVDALISEMEAGAASNATLEQRKAAREAEALRKTELERLVGECKPRADRVLDDAQRRCAEIMAEAQTSIDAILSAATAYQTDLSNLIEQIAKAEPLPEPVDLAGVRVKINDAKAINANVALKARKTEAEANVKALTEKDAQLTRQIDARTAAKEAAIAAAEMPVPGIGFADDGTMLLNGEPFNQASHMERIRTSAAIAMAGNPRLRVLRLMHGNDLDDDAFAEVVKMAAENNFQVWIERINPVGNVGFVIEDGKLKEPV